MLVLPQIDRMTLPVLRKIRDLVAAGATIVGPKPVKSPSLVGYPNVDAEVQSLASEVWGDLDGIMRNRHYSEKGQVIWGLPLANVMTSLPLPKDVECSRVLDAEFPWIHRRAGENDIYFFVNRTDRSQDINARFRVAGKEAELWHPDTGLNEPATYTIADGRTTVPLHLEPRESVFVVFRRCRITFADGVAARDEGRRDDHRAVGRKFSARPRRAGKNHVGESGVVDEEFQRRSKVFLGNRHVHENYPGAE